MVPDSSNGPRLALADACNKPYQCAGYPLCTLSVRLVNNQRPWILKPSEGEFSHGLRQRVVKDFRTKFARSLNSQLLVRCHGRRDGPEG